MKKIIVYIKIGILSISLLLINSCSKEELSPMPENLIFSLYEKFYLDSSQIMLKIYSEEEYTCSNFEIIYSVTEQEDQMVVEFEGITNHGTCVAEVGRSKAFLYIDNGDNSKSYSCKFILNDNITDLDIAIKEETVQISVSENTSGRISVFNNKLYRMHRNTVWGYLYNKAANAPANINDLLHNELFNAGAQSIELQNGYYGYFIVDKGAIFILNDNNNIIENITPFIFLFDGSLNDICEVVSSFDNHIDVFVRNTLGEKCEY